MPPTIPEMPWIIGSGWNQEKWGLGRFPTAADLDAAVPNRPVWLERVDGHAGWANSAAIAAARITAASKSPEGGRIEMEGGKPSGVFVDAAMSLIEGAKPKPLARDLDRALYLAQQKLLEQGITTIADMGTSIADWQAYRRAGDKKQLAVRILSYGGDIDNMALIAGPEPTPWLYDDRLRMVGVKLISTARSGRAARGSRRRTPTPRGKRACLCSPPRSFGNKMVRASMDRFQVAIHAIGDAANAEALAAIADLTADLPGERRWRIEHAQVIDPADIPKFAELKVIASMQPIHQPSDRVMAEARLGPQRLKGAYAWRSLENAGVRLAFGSDVPVESANPFPGIAAAISRTDATRPALRRLASRGDRDARNRARRLHAYRGLRRLRRGPDRHLDAGNARRLPDRRRRPDAREPRRDPSHDPARNMDRRLSLLRRRKARPLAGDVPTRRALMTGLAALPVAAARYRSRAQGTPLEEAQTRQAQGPAR